ncbi:MAG: acyl-CoA dehydrogenase family protein [Candidatus Promineifilaceae bacterium]
MNHLDVEPTEEQKMLVEALRRFAAGRMQPAFRDADEEGSIPEGILQAGRDFGLLPSALPEAYGGLGDYSAVTNALAVEELAAGDLAMTLALLTPWLVALPLLLDGAEPQRETWLPRFCQPGSPRATAAFCEPAVQFDLFHMQTTAVRENGSYVLNGLKSQVPLADTAETFLVYAQEDGQTQAFLVPAGAAGLEIGPREKLMGIRALPTFRLRLDDCHIPASGRLGGQAGSDFERLLSHSRIALGAAGVGLARAAWSYARDYALGRVQFGEPIAQRQAIAFMLAEMAIDVDAARLMVWEAAWLLDQGRDAGRECALLKQFVDEAALRTADRAVQILGGYGYVRDYPAELWLRNARGLAVFDGLAII